MRATIEGAGVELSYREQGTGPPVLLIHDLARDADCWAPVAAALAPHARVITYDRRGYGESSAPEPYERTTVSEQAEDAAQLLERLDAAPALICGEGLGALIALDLLLRHRDLVSSAVLGHVPLFAFVPQATEVLARERAVLEQALRDRGAEDAVADWLDGRLQGDALDRARRAHRAFFADYAGIASWPVTRAELRSIDVPLVIVTGPRAQPHVLAACDALERLVPDARRGRDGDLAAAVLSLLA
jgi:pimeloyl-ACP methyl ester carboxylesterase